MSALLCLKLSRVLLALCTPVALQIHYETPSAHTPLHTNMPHRYRKESLHMGLLVQRVWRGVSFFFSFFTLDYLNSTSPLKSFKLGKISSFPWYLACLVTNKPSCWCLKSKEQLTQAKQTSLINPKCNRKSQKCKRLKNTKGTCLFFA